MFADGVMLLLAEEAGDAGGHLRGGLVLLGPAALLALLRCSLRTREEHRDTCRPDKTSNTHPVQRNEEEESVHAKWN